MLVRFELEITEFIELWHLLQDKLLLQYAKQVYAEDEQMLEFMTNNIK